MHTLALRENSTDLKCSAPLKRKGPLSFVFLLVVARASLALHNFFFSNKYGRKHRSYGYTLASNLTHRAAVLKTETNLIKVSDVLLEEG